MARIVAGADSIEIGLLHEADIGKHGGIVYIAAIERMGVVDVGAFEEYTLAVDGVVVMVGRVDKCNVAETVFGGECHLFLLAVELAHNHTI